ncbi:MAG: hypothetical protein ORN29_06380 [Rhodoferax sp.]|nr:hypothetical protein [Rhodoferax sp.]
MESYICAALMPADASCKAHVAANLYFHLQTTRPAMTNNNLLIRLGGFILLLLLLGTGITTLGFRVAKNNQEHDFSQVEQQRIAASLARSAQVQFKTEIQEWKDILLRGENPADFAHYQAAMRSRGEQVEQLLGQLHDQMQGQMQGNALAQSLQARHRTLANSYQQALAGNTSLPLAKAIRIDKDLRGIDRALASDLDALVAQLEASAAAERVRGSAAAEQRVNQLALLVDAVVGVSMLAVLYLLWLATRRR